MNIYSKNQILHKKESTESYLRILKASPLNPRYKFFLSQTTSSAVKEAVQLLSFSSIPHLFYISSRPSPLYRIQILDETDVPFIFNTKIKDLG